MLLVGFHTGGVALCRVFCGVFTVFTLSREISATYWSDADALRPSPRILPPSRSPMRGVSQRGFFGLPIAVGTCCELDGSTLEPGVSLDISQVTLAAPLPVGPSQVVIYCNDVVLCSLSQRVPNVKVQLTVGSKFAFECVGPEGSGGVHLIGFTYASGKRRAQPEEEPEESRTEAEWLELQRGRKRRVAELQREAAAAAATPSPASTRVPRLTFNPEVLVAEYVPKRSGISPLRIHESLEEMVARREEIKARQAMEGDGGEDDEDDEGTMLQGVLAELLSCSVSKLRTICNANGLDSKGKRSDMIELLIEHIAADFKSRNEQGGAR